MQNLFSCAERKFSVMIYFSPFNLNLRETGACTDRANNCWWRFVIVELCGRWEWGVRCCEMSQPWRGEQPDWEILRQVQPALPGAARHSTTQYKHSCHTGTGATTWTWSWSCHTGTEHPPGHGAGHHCGPEGDLPSYLVSGKLLLDLFKDELDSEPSYLQ